MTVIRALIAPATCLSGCGQDATVGVKTNLLGLVRVCACVNALAIDPIITIGGSEQACPAVRATKSISPRVFVLLTSP